MSSTPRRPIAELQFGDRLDDHVFLVNEKDFRTTTNGGNYIHAVLADNTGQMVARMWDASQAIFDAMTTGGLMRFKGRVESYRGKPQFIIEGTRAVDPDDFDPAEFLPKTPCDIEPMWERTKEILRQIENPHLLKLVAKFINDPEFASSFCKAPAAVAMHHAYIGGLLEHTLGLLELALVVLPRYPEVSKDLVLTGIILHDAGKTRELTYETNFSYTSEGNLVGHIVMCVTWIDAKAKEIETETGEPIPADLLNVLKHIIVAHHGQYEFGSPKLPSVAEAIMLHYLDNLDAKMAMCRHYIANDKDESSDWTGFIPALQTRLYKPDIMGIHP